MLIFFPPGATAGGKIKKLRKSQGLTQYELAERIGEPYGCIHRIETGRTKSPPMDVIEKILNELKISKENNFNIYQNVLVSFGHRVAISEPSKSEGEWAKKIFQEEIKSTKLTIPALMMDCTTRIWDWNHYFSYIIPSEYLEVLKHIRLIDAYLKSDAPLAKRIENYDEFLQGTIKGLKQTFWQYQEEQWMNGIIVQHIQSNPAIKHFWEAINACEKETIQALRNEMRIPARPLHPLKVRSLKNRILSFRIGQEPVTGDHRFRVIYWHPADVKTIKQIEEWTREYTTS